MLLKKQKLKKIGEKLLKEPKSGLRAALRFYG